MFHVKHFVTLMNYLLSKNASLYNLRAKTSEREREWLNEQREVELVGAIYSASERKIREAGSHISSGMFHVKHFVRLLLVKYLGFVRAHE